jgi:hypothetical protein
MDTRDLRILLTSIIEIRELYSELIDPRKGASVQTCEAIHELGMERLERVESGKYYSEQYHSGTD